MKYNIVICEDDPAFGLQLSEMVSDYLEGIGKELYIHLYESAEKALSENKGEVDLYILDEQMGGMSGTELAMQIRESENYYSAIIFVSNIHDAVYKSLRCAPLRFIRKSQLEEELPEALEAFMSRHAALDQNITLDIGGKSDNHTLLFLRDIVYLESQKHYVYFHCRKDEVYQTRGKISDYDELLKKHHFARSSKSFIVNLRYATSILSKLVLLTGNTEIPLSEKYRREFEQLYLKHKRDMNHFQ